MGQAMAEHINMCLQQGVSISLEDAQEHIQKQLPVTASPLKKRLVSVLKNPTTPKKEIVLPAAVQLDPTMQLSTLLDDASMLDSPEKPNRFGISVTAPIAKNYPASHASPLKPDPDVDCNRYYYHKYPSLTPAEIDEIRAPLRDVRQRIRRVMEIQTAWLAIPVSEKTVAAAQLATQVAAQQKELGQLNAALIETRQGVDTIMAQLPRFMEMMRMKTEDHEQLLQQCVLVQETVSRSMTGGTC